MRIFQVNNIEDYKKCIIFAFNRGSKNYMGDEIPVFNNIEDFIDIWEINGLYDENGEPTWKEIDGVFPDSVLEIIANKRLEMLKEIGVDFPFVVVINGESGFDRMGSIQHQTFYETKLKEVDEMSK